MSMVVWSKSAGIIWQATKRFQISRYSFISSSARYFSTTSGANAIEVGRMASCASCASFLDL